MEPLIQLILAAVISGTVASALIGIFFTGYVTRKKLFISSQMEWKKEAVEEVLAPMNIQFDRSKKAFQRWTEKNLFLEAKIIKVANEKILNLLLTKSHLVPPELLDDANKLIEHYDVWLELFEKQRKGKQPDLESAFTFAGPEGYPFPKKSEKNFKEKYYLYWGELYGEQKK